MRRVRDKAIPPAFRRAACWAALGAVLVLLPVLGGCAKKTWCHPTFSKATMQADLKFCRQKLGQFGEVHPDDLRVCMQSLSWHQCEK